MDLQQLGNNWSETNSPPIKSYTLNNFRDIPQIAELSDEQQFEIEVVGNVFPFKSNNYVVENLIDWENIPFDPMFILNFPQKEMLRPHHYEEMAKTLKTFDKKQIRDVANKIRMQLRPHPAGQLEYNIPQLKDGTVLCGMQHKYKETVLFFPSQGQTCHAYCTFCFRWPQFVGIKELHIAMREGEHLVQYLKEHPEVTDVLFTGGDPMVMNSDIWKNYLEGLLDANLPNLQTIRIGTKSLSYWPYRYISDSDAEDILNLFRKVTQKGLHLAIISHFNHYRELSTKAVSLAIRKIRDTGAQIRTQSPLLRYINDDSVVWEKMWKQQVRLGLIPYYMFIVRDTGAQHHFGIPLIQAQKIFRDAYSKVSGMCRTVRGPTMSTTSGKIQILGESSINDKKVIVLRFLQGRDPKWVHRPFYAKYDDKAIWLNELKPAFGNKFFFEDELKIILRQKIKNALKAKTTCV